MRIVQVAGGTAALGALILGMTACQSSEKPRYAPVAPNPAATSPGAPTAAQDSPSPAPTPPPGTAPGTAASPTALPATAPPSAVPQTGAPNLPTVPGAKSSNPLDPQEPIDPQRPEHTFPASQ